MPAVQACSYRRTDLDAGREATLLSQALELAARCVQRPVSAVEALRAAEAELCGQQTPRPWPESKVRKLWASSSGGEVRVSCSRPVSSTSTGRWR